MNPELITAISSGIAAIIVSASVFLTAWMTNKKVEQRAVQTENTVVTAANTLADVTRTQSGTQVEKLDEIHQLVNSRLDQALAEIAWLKQRLSEQEEA